MLLNAVEKALMNNPVRSAIQRRVEAARLLHLGGPMQGGRALEIGCGRGVGVQLILDTFGADRVDGFDLDPEMVQLARGRLLSRGDHVCLRTGDVTHIDAPDGHYDAVFDFGIVHHVPDWRTALREVHRVLKPGGRFYGEEIYARTVRHPVVAALLDHPVEHAFDEAALLGGLREAGFEVIQHQAVGGWFGWFVADRPTD